jgi:hypothetical protein
MTDVPLREFIEARFNHMEGQIAALRVLLDERQTSGAAALKVAAETLEVRLQHLNEFREQVLSERAQFVTSDRLDAVISPIVSTLTDISTRQATVRGRDIVIGSMAFLLGSGLVTVLVAWLTKT